MGIDCFVGCGGGSLIFSGDKGVNGFGGRGGIWVLGCCYLYWFFWVMCFLGVIVLVVCVFGGVLWFGLVVLGGGGRGGGGGVGGG